MVHLKDLMSLLKRHHSFRSQIRIISLDEDVHILSLSIRLGVIIAGVCSALGSGGCQTSWSSIWVRVAKATIRHFLKDTVAQSDLHSSCPHVQSHRPRGACSQRIQERSHHPTYEKYCVTQCCLVAIDTWAERNPQRRTFQSTFSHSIFFWIFLALPWVKPDFQRTMNLYCIILVNYNVVFVKVQFGTVTSASIETVKNKQTQQL